MIIFPAKNDLMLTVRMKMDISRFQKVNAVLPWMPINAVF